MGVSKHTIALIRAIDADEVVAIRKSIGTSARVDEYVDGKTLLHHAVDSKAIGSIQTLAEIGANLNLLDSNQITPLMSACLIAGRQGCEVANVLLDLGCDSTYRREFDRMSALEFAVKQSAPELVQRLIDLGLPVDGPRSRKLTPAMIAARAGNIDALGVLIENGCDLTIPCRLPWADGKTCLEIAQMERKRKVVEYLENLTT